MEADFIFTLVLYGLDWVGDCGRRLGETRPSKPVLLTFQSLNFLPVSQRMKTLTNGVSGRTRVVGREFESHATMKNYFQRRANVLMQNLKNTPGSP